MKTLPFLAALALVACSEAPTSPSSQSAMQPDLSIQSAQLRSARNPSGTGQPGAECGDPNASVQPKGFDTGGFANAETHYAGSDGTPSAAHGNSHAVSQYDVACYQLSNK